MKNLNQILIILFFVFSINPVRAQDLFNVLSEKNSNGDSFFGYSVSTAGDVNGDGYNDVIVGAYMYENYTGKAYIYFGGDVIDSIADLTLFTGELQSGFGYSVSSAGDLNGDGFDDLVVGAHYSGSGKAYVYFGGTSMDSIPDLTLTGNLSKSFFGYSVSSAGDVNADGYDDVLVGTDGTSQCEAYVFLGGLNMDSIADLVFHKDTILSNFGVSVAGVGDVNDDGYDDVVIGDPYYGTAHLFYGNNSLDTICDLTFYGFNNTGDFGNSVSGADDVNADGYDDVIIGEKGYANGKGRAYIFYGGAGMDNVADITFTGETSKTFNTSLGNSVSKAGDVNGDGFDDVIVGASTYIDCKDMGRAYIYFGGGNMDNVADVILNGESNDNYFACSVSGACDMNNDGYDDVIAGAYKYINFTGRSYIYYGGSSVDNSADVVMTGEGTKNSFGQKVATAGDVNNDGLDDFLVYAPQYNFGKGRVYLYLGDNLVHSSPDLIFDTKAEIMQSAGDINNDGYDDLLIVNSINNKSSRFINIYYGGSVLDTIPDVNLICASINNYDNVNAASAGDVNNDSYDDIIVSGWNNYSFNSNAFIFYGNEAMDTIPDVVLNGGLANMKFSKVFGAGDVNGDGYDDVMIGTSWNNPNLMYFFFGGETVDNTVDLTVPISSFSYFMDKAGDLNGDGFSDILISDPNFTTSWGRVLIYYGSSTMDSLVDVTLNSLTGGSYFGTAAVSAGDLNADGFDDIIVGEKTNYNYLDNVYFYFGSANMDNVVDMVLKSEGGYDFFGTSLAGAGDVNSDGNPDILIGASNYSANGKVYLYGFEPKILQYINFDELDRVSYGCAPFDLTATSSSGLPVSYSSSDQSVATIDGNTISILKSNFSNITASQPGNDEFYPAVDVKRAILVDRANLIISADNQIKPKGIEFNFSGKEFSAVGLLSTDEISEVTLYSYGSSSSSRSGIYDIDIYNAMGSGLGNYNISYKEGSMEVIDIDVNLNSIVLKSGENRCFDAIDNITVAATSPVVLEENSTATFIAGNSIRFLPGFHAQSGSSMQAYITTTNAFCLEQSQQSVVYIQPLEKSLIDTILAFNFAVELEEIQLKVYPNPSNGRFTIECIGFENNAEVTIFNLLGAVIYRTSFDTKTPLTIEVPVLTNGLYYVVVQDSQSKRSTKIMITDF